MRIRLLVVAFVALVAATPAHASQVRLLDGILRPAAAPPAFRLSQQGLANRAGDIALFSTLEVVSSLAISVAAVGVPLLFFSRDPAYNFVILLLGGIVGIAASPYFSSLAVSAIEGAVFGKSDFAQVLWVSYAARALSVVVGMLVASGSGRSPFDGAFYGLLFSPLTGAAGEVLAAHSTAGLLGGPAPLRSAADVAPVRAVSTPPTTPLLSLAF